MEAIIGLITAFDMKAGALLEDLTVAKARAGIEKLVHLTPQTARVITDGTENSIPAEQVKVGDLWMMKSRYSGEKHNRLRSHFESPRSLFLRKD